jgi:hypothetical protein
VAEGSNPSTHPIKIKRLISFELPGAVAIFVAIFTSRAAVLGPVAGNLHRYGSGNTGALHVPHG